MKLKVFQTGSRPKSFGPKVYYSTKAQIFWT